MTTPALPAENNTTWYAHYSWLDEMLRRLRVEVATGNPVGTAPTTGLDVFTRLKAGRELLAARSATETTPYQPAMYSQKVALLSAAPGLAVPTATGWSPAVTGTQALMTPAATNAFTRASRNRYNSAATASAAAGVRSAGHQCYRADGFFFACRFGIGASVATNRLFVGLSTTLVSLSLTVEMSTLFNMIGFGCDSSQTTMRLVHNDGAGAAVVTDLGVDFPVNTSSLDLYEVCLYCEPGGTTVQWSIERVIEAGAKAVTPKYASGTITSTDIPSTTTGLAAHIHHGNAATAAAAGVDMQFMYVETDV